MNNALLVRQLDRAFDVRSWHGPNLMGSLRGVAGDLITWRPQPDRHNIGELVVHAAYWKYRVCRLIDHAGTPEFDLPGSDFFEREPPVLPKAWKADLALLQQWHKRLRTITAAVPTRRLDEVPPRSEFSTQDLLLGAAAHDLYHAGQIRLIRRMYGDRA
jgi:hypothetical protein